MLFSVNVISWVPVGTRLKWTFPGLGSGLPSYACKNNLSGLCLEREGPEMYSVRKENAFQAHDKQPHTPLKTETLVMGPQHTDSNPDLICFFSVMRHHIPDLWHSHSSQVNTVLWVYVSYGGKTSGLSIPDWWRNGSSHRRVQRSFPAASHSMLLD